MGATNCPETPRQKMIGMMYLVLTAMLALNVSVDILNAFTVVNDTMVQTNENLDSKVDQSYAMFEKAVQNEGEKVKPFYQKALEVKKVSKSMIDYLESVKTELLVVVDGITPEEAKIRTLQDMEAKSNYDKPTNYFIGQADNGKAYEMSTKIKDMKAELVKIVGDDKFRVRGLDVDAQFTNSLTREKRSWEQHNFDHVVAAACYTLLNNFIGEVLNIEFETVAFLYSAIDAGTFKFDNVSAKVIPNSRVVFSGDSYEADIIVAAYDSRQDPEVYWGSSRDTATAADVDKLTLIQGEAGVVRLKIPAGAVGDQRFAGMIKLKGPEGDEFYPFKESYTVTKPTAAVAADKMNVFYAGIPNPVSIAAPVAPEKLRPSWGGCTAKPLGGGKYELSVPNSLVGKEVTISVAADVGTGKVQNMGNTVFRVKAVPPPTSFIGTKLNSGKYPKDQILANSFISAQMENFDFDLKWQIVSYRVIIVKNGREGTPIPVTGPRFPSNLVNEIRSASSGTVIEFSEITAKSIAGTKQLRPLMVRVR